MGRPGGPLVLLLALLLPGCLGGPKLTYEDAFSQSDATHDGTTYKVNLRGRVVNGAAEPAVWVRVLAAVGHDCLSDPEAWPGFVDVGNLAPRASAPVRGTFEQEGPLSTQPTLWWRITHTDTSRQVAKGCGALPVG